MNGSVVSVRNLRLNPSWEKSFESTRVVCLLIFLALESSAESRAGEFTFHHENVLGTSDEFRFHCDLLETAVEAEEMLLQEIDRLRGIYSTYESDSEICRWLAGEADANVS